jgi:pullulanase/glycogen debranching enzyme
MHKKDLDKFYSSKRLGSFTENDKTIFRLFAPQAERVLLIIYPKVENSSGKKFKMVRDNDGVWEASLDGNLHGSFYGYQVKHKNKKDEVVCIDPYAKAIATFNNYLNPRKSIVVKDDNYDWENDHWIQRDWRDLIIYEMHLRDMTAHPSSGAKFPGTYKGLIEKGITGGIEYIKKLGVNTVEFLPVQEFANIEIPFNKNFFNRKNNWNPYETNHWGYMTAAFFAPDSYYSDGGKGIKWKSWSGQKAKQVKEFKDVVKEFHKNGIAVIMDVVYNHLSEYELGNLKEIDKEYYFRTDSHGNLSSKSYTGNDLKTERPMMRRLIIDSILYWMNEYHIDGFRFDIAILIDWQTIEEIAAQAQRINPNVILIAEPWGNSHDPTGFSLRGFSSWNDQIRNGVKGENPHDGKGWLFENWFGNNDYNRIRSYIQGTLVKDKHGLFQMKEHSVNYLESHDGYTLGDFIRLALGDVEKEQIIDDTIKNIALTPLQLKINKLAALFLFVSQGIVMIHAGQEFARSKVISPNTKVKDPNIGKLDHNSYEKDNETNFINYEHAEINNELLSYYKSLIRLRNTYETFRRPDSDEIKFYDNHNNPFLLSFELNHKEEHFVVYLNAYHEKEFNVSLPEGRWQMLVNEDIAGTKGHRLLENELKIQAISGYVLRKV